MSFDVSQVRRDFPIFQREINGKRLVFLDSAASAQKPQAVIDALVRVYSQSYANVHRGIYTLAEEATSEYELAREKIAQFINAHPTEIVNVRNTTEALNLLAYSWGEANIEGGDRIIITEMEHHANLVPWQQLALRKHAELAFIPVTDEGELDLSALPPLLADGHAKLVACTMASNVLGTLTPIQEVVRLAREAGAVTVVDAAQAAPHIPLDVKAIGADFLAFSGHKMCSPDVGILWGRHEMLESLPPFLFGGDMIRAVRKYDSCWNDVPYKFEAGTPAIAEVIALGAAVDYLTQLGMDAIHEHEVTLVKYAMEQLADIPEVHILGPSAERRGGVVSFWMDCAHPHDIASILDEEGICVRAGHHCAQPLHTRFGVQATARASFYVYNDESDVDALVAALRNVVKLLQR